MLKHTYGKVAEMSHRNNRYNSEYLVVRREVTTVEYTVRREHAGRPAPQFRAHKGRRPYNGASDRSCRHRQQVFGGRGPRSRLAVSDSSRDVPSQNRVQQPRGGGRGEGGGAFRGGEQGSGASGWYKVTIPNGKKYEKWWLLTALSNICSVRFTPVQYHVASHAAIFFVSDPAAADVIKKSSFKITDMECCKIRIMVARSAPPPACMSQPRDWDLLKAGHHLTPPTGVKTPTATPPPTAMHVETPTTTPPSKDCCFATDKIKGLILRFLQEYYSVFDSGDRQTLLGAYHDRASLSITTQNPSRSSLGEHLKGGATLKAIKDSSTKLHRGCNIVAFLSKFPKIQHDLASFTIDVNSCTDTVLSFTVNGVFREAAADGRSQESILAFSRVFTTVPAGNSGLCITNDQLFLRMATAEEIRRAFVAPSPTTSSSLVPTLAAPQQQMLRAFSKQSGMNMEWSHKCLQDNQWDANRAGLVFARLKAVGKIPNAAFIQ